MHPLVRDLYKRVLLVGRDYPTGLQHVKEKWKSAIREPRNCPNCYSVVDGEPQQIIVTLSHESSQMKSEKIERSSLDSKECHEEILHAVHRGRSMVKEMVGIIQLKKYRTMKGRYDTNDDILPDVDTIMEKFRGNNTNNVLP